MTDVEASAVPAAAGAGIIDAHVHLFPDRLFDAVWRWFDRYGWVIRYKLYARDCARFLLSRGIERIVALHYAHVPGLAPALNRFVAELAREEPRIVPFATVLPGEPGARRILDDALGALGCRGVKIHCHVQCVAPDDPRLDDVYAAAAAFRVPVLIHAGDGPSSPHYKCDVRALCQPHALARALGRHRSTTFIVPHLGATRIDETAALLGENENLHLDTTMMLGGYFPVDDAMRPRGDAAARRLIDEVAGLLRRWPSRILYGSDFPNIPYAWDTEIATLSRLDLSVGDRTAILSGNARRLLGVAAAKVGTAPP